MGGVVGAIAGPIVGGLFGQASANTQAQGATQAASTAANAQMAGLQFVQGQEAPYNQIGQQALGQYAQLLGLPGLAGGSSAPQIQARGGTAARPGVAPQGPGLGGNAGGNTGGNAGGNFDVSKLPGYQFELQQGLGALQNSAASRGQALSGNTIQGVEQFGQGLASTQFQQYMQQLAGLANMGQASASGVANQGANLLSGAGASLASGQNAAAGYNAAGITNLGNMFQTAFNAPQTQQGLGSLLGQSNTTSGLNQIL